MSMANVARGTPSIGERGFYIVPTEQSCGMFDIGSAEYRMECRTDRYLPSTYIESPWQVPSSADVESNPVPSTSEYSDWDGLISTRYMRIASDRGWKLAHIHPTPGHVTGKLAPIHPTRWHVTSISAWIAHCLCSIVSWDFARSSRCDSECERMNQNQ
jgi:hypothetical protein